MNSKIALTEREAAYYNVKEGDLFCGSTVCIIRHYNPNHALAWYDKILARGNILAFANGRDEKGELQIALIEMPKRELSPTVIEYRESIRKRFKENQI